MSTQNTILNTLMSSAAFILNRPSTGVAGTYQDPGLTIANLTMSTILSPPFAWQWNRSIFTFSTVVEQSDYTVSLPAFGWLEKATLSTNGGDPPIVELEIKSLLAASGKPNVPDWICVANDDNSGNITFRLMAIPDQVYVVTLTYQRAPIFATSLYANQSNLTSAGSGVGGLTVYPGTITNGAANALAGLYLYVYGFTGAGIPNNGIYLCNSSSSTQVVLQNLNGVAITQPAFVAVATTWAPIPDKYNFLYERGTLAMLHKMYDQAAYLQELQLFYRSLVGCSEGLSETAKAIFLEDKLAQLRTMAEAQSSSTAAPRRGQ